MIIEKDINIEDEQFSATIKKESELSISRSSIIYYLFIKEESIEKYRSVLLETTYNYNKRTKFFNIRSNKHSRRSMWWQYVSTNYVRVVHKSESDSNTASEDISNHIFQLSDIIYRKLFK